LWLLFLPSPLHHDLKKGVISCIKELIIIMGENL
jgi:hypothetical protein